MFGTSREGHTVASHVIPAREQLQIKLFATKISEGVALLQVEGQVYFLCNFLILFRVVNFEGAR